MRRSGYLWIPYRLPSGIRPLHPGCSILRRRKRDDAGKARRRHCADDRSRSTKRRRFVLVCRLRVKGIRLALVSSLDNPAAETDGSGPGKERPGCNQDCSARKEEGLDDSSNAMNIQVKRQGDVQAYMI